jgi:hypothetical protein
MLFRFPPASAIAAQIPSREQAFQASRSILNLKRTEWFDG